MNCNFTGAVRCFFVLLYWILGVVLNGARRKSPVVNDTKLDSPPKHLALLFNSKDLNFADVANLVLWSAKCNIQILNLYDPSGVLKANPERLLEAIKSLDSSNPLPITFRNSPATILRQRNTPSPPSNTLLSSFEIRLTCEEDGREAILLGVQQMCQEVQKGGLSTENIANYEFMNVALTAENGSLWCAPDFVITYDNSLIWNGFLPWQIRYSEILHIGAAPHQITYAMFVDSLHTFGKVQRRFGK